MKTSLINKLATWKKSIRGKLSSYKKRAMKPQPTDALLIGVILNILNTLYKDTQPNPNLDTIPIQYWTSILLVFLLTSSFTLLWSAPSNFQNNVLSYAIMLSIIGTILNILDFSLDLIAYNLVLTFVSVLTLLSLLKVQSNLSRIYVGLFLLVLLDVLTILYDSFKFYKEIRIFFEILFIFGIGYFIYKSNFNRKQLTLLLASLVVGRVLGNFIFNRELPFLIFSTVINQLLGTYVFSKNFYGVELTLEMIFVLHITEFAILIVALFINRPSTLLITIILSGFDMTYAPIAGFRAIAIMYHFNRNDPNINKFNLFRRSPSEPV